jgi:hypothetical protein
MAISFGASGIPSYMTPSRTPTRRPSGASASRTSQPVAPTPRLTPAQSAYGPSGVPSRADVQALQRSQARQQQQALWSRPSSGGDGGDSGGGGGDGGDSGGEGGGGARTFNFEDYARDFRDPEYNAQIASLNRALQDFETGAQQRGERYGIDYLQGVRNIGYRPSPGFVAMPNILEAGQDGEEGAAPMARSARAITGAEEPDATRGMRGMWDIEGQFDPYSAAARGTRGLRDEFAARGTLRGSDFGQTFGEFQNRLNEQLEAMETGRTRFAEDLSSELAQQRATTEERRQAAERAAVNRANTAQMNAFMRALAGG